MKAETVIFVSMYRDTAKVPYDAQHFEEEVCDLVSRIPRGKVITYGTIARLLCAPGYARRVGAVLKAAPETVHLPCHRVVSGTGRLVPGWEAQRTLLEAEGIPFRRNGCADLRRALWEEVR